MIKFGGCYKISIWSKDSKGLDTLEDWLFSKSAHKLDFIYSFFLPFLITFLNWNYSFWIVDCESDWLHIIWLMYVIKFMKECELDFQVWNLRLIALAFEISTIQLDSRGLWPLTDFVLIKCMKSFIWMLELDWGLIQPNFNHWIGMLVTN